MKIIRMMILLLTVLTVGHTQAQTVKETVDSVKSGLKASSVKDAYSKINDSFKLKKASADALVGTWCYKEPAVYATKGNLLLKMARIIAGHEAHGVWLVNGEKLVLGIGNVLTADITTHLEDGELMMLIDVDKLLTHLKTLGAMKDTKANKRLIKLTKRIPGLQAGLLLVKKD